MHRRTLLTSALSLASALALASAAGGAMADAPFGPKPGAPAPAIGGLEDQAGHERRLLDLAGPKGVVLMFFRSAAWCPYCQAQLIAMNEGAADIESRGYKIVGISYDKPSVNAEFTQRRAITYTLLSDPGSKTIDGWGLRDPQYPPGNLAYGVPRPIIFVIDRQGVIKASLAEDTFRKRPPVSEVVKAIDALP